MYVFFFFQAEDGIRDYKVTGVQTCALPICALPDGPISAGITELVANDPPEIGPSGSALSPSSTSILSSGTPVFCEASCARIVYVPVPMSCVAHATRTVPSSRSWRLASAANAPAIHAAPDIPQPKVKPSRFIAPTAGSRFDQPNLSAPRFKHST